MTKITDFLEVPAEDLTVLRIDVVAYDASFGNDLTHDACLILENEDGVQDTIEYIELNDFCDFLDFTEYDTIIQWLKVNSIDLEEPGIEFSVKNPHIIEQAQNFRLSSYNKSNFYKLL